MLWLNAEVNLDVMDVRPLGCNSLMQPSGKMKWVINESKIRISVNWGINSEARRSNPIKSYKIIVVLKYGLKRATLLLFLHCLGITMLSFKLSSPVLASLLIQFILDSFILA